MATTTKKRRGLSPERLKALRKKYGLGEFRGKRTTVASSGSSSRGNRVQVDMTGSNGTYEVGLSPAEQRLAESYGPQAVQGSHAGIP